MTDRIPADTYARIAEAIHSDDSPVGIDAKKTHILILHALERLEERLGRIEARLAGGPAGSGSPSERS